MKPVAVFSRRLKTRKWLPFFHHRGAAAHQTMENHMYLHPHHRHLSRRFGFEAQPAAASWTPRVDVKEEAARFAIFIDVPGIDPQAIEIQADGNLLSIAGERAATNAGEGERFSRVERRHGKFERRFALPDTADTAAITASGRNGVLEISIPKKAHSQPRKIHVGVTPLDNEGADEAPASVQ